jgi:hypothetical protein
VGTAFVPNAEQKAVLSKFILDGLQWSMIYTPKGNFYDPSVVGRQISRPSGLGALSNASRIVTLTAGWYRTRTCTSGTGACSSDSHAHTH